MGIWNWIDPDNGRAGFHKGLAGEAHEGDTMSTKKKEASQLIGTFRNSERKGHNVWLRQQNLGRNAFSIPTSSGSLCSFLSRS